MPAGQTLDHPLATGCPPLWASGWGEDDFGPWVEIAFGVASQRIRWIPPGRFMMGVAENEEHYDWEKVGQREVVIAKGFWLFDTPCTQDLWEAVMGDNPSHFKGARLPVETVSWQDAHRFVDAVNERSPELNLALPTEAQWEYVCRAGTTSARYAKDLDAIAWYSENSGQRTHEVAGKDANKWGLHDMLGNVWEWCEDKFDPSDEDTSARRVYRGGSWLNDARSARAAYRNPSHPGNRFQSLGFRCSSSGSEPAGG